MSAASDLDRYTMRADEGMCVSCGYPARGYRRCFRCRRKRAAEQARRDAAKKVRS